MPLGTKSFCSWAAESMAAILTGTNLQTCSISHAQPCGTLLFVSGIRKVWTELEDFARRWSYNTKQMPILGVGNISLQTTHGSPQHCKFLLARLSEHAPLTVWQYLWLPNWGSTIKADVPKTMSWKDSEHFLGLGTKQRMQKQQGHFAAFREVKKNQNKKKPQHIFKSPCLFNPNTQVSFSDR